MASGTTFQLEKIRRLVNVRAASVAHGPRPS